MALPKIKQPVFDMFVPSTGKGVKFRPFLDKEEKLLLIAQTGGSNNDMINALIQVIGNCVYNLDGKPLNTTSLTTFDLEYMFLKLRARSVDNISKLTFRDVEDDKEYTFEVNLDEIEVFRNPEHTNKIKVNDEISLTLNYPTAAFVVGALAAPTQADVSNRLILDCINTIYDANNVYLASESTRAELEEFLESALTHRVRVQIEQFFATMPKLYHKITYKNSKGSEREIVLDSLEDFFTLA